MTTLQEARRALMNARDDLHSCIRWHNGDVWRNSQKESERVAWDQQRLMLQASVNRIEDTLRSALARQGDYKDKTPELSVGDSSFESWYATYNSAHKGDKQRARDAYAAGMGDPLAQQGQEPVAEVFLLTKGGNVGLAKGVRILQDRDGCDFELRHGDKLYTAAPAPQPAQDVPEVGFGNIPYSPYLFGGLRFKMNFDKSGNATNFHGVETALQGAWVVLVDATDNRHIQSAQPVAQPPYVQGG